MEVIQFKTMAELNGDGEPILQFETQEPNEAVDALNLILQSGKD